VVVSIGWSVLGQEDHSLSDIFERADQMMYERKKELKAQAPAAR
jgi:GGDEF domain-containing protein